MARKKRQIKPSKRVPKQEMEGPDAGSPPGSPGTVESAEGSMISESVATEAAVVSPPIPPAAPAFAPEGGLPGVDERESHAIEEAAEAPLEELELLTFNLADEEYAVDIGVIQEITKVMEMTHIPRIQPYIKGIITLRGNVIPIFDMRARLGLAPFVKGPENRFIICTTEQGRAAMLVDRVNDVVRQIRHTLESPPAGIVAMDAGFIKSIARYENRLLILLDMEKTLRIDR